MMKAILCQQVTNLAMHDNNYMSPVDAEASTDKHQKQLSQSKLTD